MEPPGPQIRIAGSYDLPAARQAYLAWGYHGGIESEAEVFLAERGDTLVGVVRLTLEDGVRMLRGMQVAPAERRKGTGTRLLHALVERLGADDPCFCVPFAHLTGFYGQGGFVEWSPDAAPSFLGERIARYRDEGHSITLMRRPALTESHSRRST